jgi:lipopolysaccharide export system permease protein
LALALLIFVTYNNMLNVGQSWISTGRTDATTFMLGLHGGFFLLAASWLAVLHFNLSWRTLLPRRTSVRQGLT